MKRTAPFALASLSASLVAIAAVAAPPVLVEPVRAEVDRNWLYEVRESRTRAGAPRESDVRAIADELAKSLQGALDKALREQGFEVVTSPSPGAVTIAARLDDLHVSAPENTASGVTSYARQAGRATLRVQARDPGGNVLMETRQQAEPGDMGRLQRASDVSNRFWFEALFRDWSDDVARELKQKAR